MVSEGPGVATIFNIGTTAALSVRVAAEPGTELVQVEGPVDHVGPGRYLTLRFRASWAGPPTFVVRWRWPAGSRLGEVGKQVLSLEDAK